MAQPRVVWLNAFARSGSSTLLSLLELADLKEVPGAEATTGRRLNLLSSRGQVGLQHRVQAQQKVFALFEPCDEGNVLGGELRKKGCEGLVRQMMHCDFSEVQQLSHWE